MIEYRHIIPPHLFKGRDGILYLIPMWTPVPDNTTLADINWINPYTKTKVFITKFKSSRGDVEYTVNKIGKEYQCSCSGFLYKNKLCKHIKQVIGDNI